MKMTDKNPLSQLPKIVMAAALSAMLVACGGGTSGDTMEGDNNSGGGDNNNDGVIDFLDGDFNNDDVITDLDLDFNLDGLVNSEDDRNMDQIVDAADFDINGDFIANELDDTNNDGKIDLLDIPVVDLGPCEQGTGGTDTDPDSSDNNWDNNCVISATGPHKQSSYARGIQRMMFCTGNADGATDINVYADGDFGPNTKAAVERFQTSQSIGVDGIVGKDTWGALRDSLVRIETGNEYDVWGYDTGDCANQALFYQKLDSDFNGVSWEMAETPGSTTRVPFSTGI